MNIKKCESFRRLMSMLLVAVMMLGMCVPALAAVVPDSTGGMSSDAVAGMGANAVAGDASGDVDTGAFGDTAGDVYDGPATITVDWSMSGTAITGTSTEVEDANTMNVNVSADGWKEYVYEGVLPGNVISLDTRDGVSPFLTRMAVPYKDYGESVTGTDLALLMGVSESALGSSLPKVKNGYCYLMPDIPRLTGSGYVTVLAVYRGLSWNDSEDVIPGTEALGTETDITVPASAITGESVTLKAQWDFYGFPTLKKLFDGTNTTNAPSAAEIADATAAAEVEAAELTDQSNVYAQENLSLDGKPKSDEDDGGSETAMAQSAMVTAKSAKKAVAAATDVDSVIGQQIYYDHDFYGLDVLRMSSKTGSINNVIADKLISSGLDANNGPYVYYMPEWGGNLLEADGETRYFLAEDGKRHTNLVSSSGIEINAEDYFRDDPLVPILMDIAYFQLNNGQQNSLGAFAVWWYMAYQALHDTSAEGNALRENIERLYTNFDGSTFNSVSNEIYELYGRNIGFWDGVDASISGIGVQIRGCLYDY